MHSPSPGGLTVPAAPSHLCYGHLIWSQLYWLSLGLTPTVPGSALLGQASSSSQGAHTIDSDTTWECHSWSGFRPVAQEEQEPLK